jgi:cobalt-zinc-cadmium resistance protein CzcA
MQLQFQLLLNTQTVYTPQAENPKMIFTATLDTSSISNHPQLKVLQQQKQISLVNTQLQKSKLFPELHIGYYNQSIQGTGADNLLYTKSTRFSSVQFGVGVPLFFGSQKGKINSSKMLELISANNYQIGLQAMKTVYETAFMNYQTQLQTVKYFEDTALQNAKTITKTANQQFANGDINYLEWTMLINNAVSIQSNYADAVKELNHSIIQLNFLTSK